MEITTSAKGQIVIPATVRRQLGIKEGTRIVVTVDEANKQIVLTPITREYIHSLRGKYKGRGMLAALEEERERDREREGQ
jgi:AbrB family looped-hinge helix DNA binding protein